MLAEFRKKNSVMQGTKFRKYMKVGVLGNFAGPIALGWLGTIPGKRCCIVSRTCLHLPAEASQFQRRTFSQYQLLDAPRPADVDFVIGKISSARSEEKILQLLMHDEACDAIAVSHNLVAELLHCFKDDWKSALASFRWAESCPGFEHSSEAYDLLVDILGKMRQFDKMKELVGEMRQKNLVTLKTVARIMRRYAGADQWLDAIRTFDDLQTFGLKKNVESMNLLLDTLCKENQVEQAREIFMTLKSHIPANAHTFNIFIHGWCNAGRVEEACWTIQEMKGQGFQPCVISYSTIIQSYCQKSNYGKVYELFDEMETQGCPPNVVTYTTVMCSLTKSEKLEEALQIFERMKMLGCKPDTLFYNALLHTLGRAGCLREAFEVFKVEMPKNGVSPNTSTYNTLVAMFCRYNQEHKALNILEDMVASTECKPDLQTFFPLLKSCLKSGNTEKLFELLGEIIHKHHLSLDISTYKLLIHGLCRIHECEQAYLLFEEMLRKGLTPKNQTCRLLLDEVKQTSMYDAAERVEDYMKQLKAS